RAGRSDRRRHPSCAPAYVAAGRDQRWQHHHLELRQPRYAVRLSTATGTRGRHRRRRTGGRSGDGRRGSSRGPAGSAAECGDRPPCQRRRTPGSVLLHPRTAAGGPGVAAGGALMVVGEIAEAVDLLVVGAGTGGYTAALRAAQQGREVTLVDQRLPEGLGGVCLHDGCIPSKMLIDAATRVAGTRT